ncbi:MAG: GNAT family N-acetyltransferase [Byssovorax sp.]
MHGEARMELVWPNAACLPSYAQALARGWSSDSSRPQAAGEQLARIEADPEAFLASLVLLKPGGETILLPDGSRVPRIPGYHRWMWDGEFCGTIGLRWQPGTQELPPHCLGHIGYGVVPWKQQRGYATRALALLLPEAKAQGLSFVEITTDPTNVASRRVIEANGGVLFEHFTKPARFGGVPGVRYRISLP